jgi:signal transduction histidine kinase
MPWIRNPTTDDAPSDGDRARPVSSALPDGYAAEQAERCQEWTVTACVLATVLLATFAVIDAIVFPELLLVLARVRLVYVVVLVLVAFLLRGELARRHALGAGLALGLLLGVMVDVLVALTGGVESPYYAGNSLVLIGISVLTPWPPVWALLSSTTIVAAYVATVLLVPVSNPVALTSALAFLGGTAVISVVASALGERLRRREFSGRVALAQALKHKSEFLASVSHDLRTPLNVVIGYSQLLAEGTFGTLNPDQRDTVERIIRTSTMQMTLINDLLDLARIEQGKLAYHCQPVAIGDLVPQLRDMMDALLRARPIRFEADVTHDAITWSDPERLVQVLANLLTNAAKFTREGYVRLAAARDGALVRVSVADSGPGMDPDLQARALEPFVRGDADAPGWGLGLAIVDRLVRLLNGRIEIESRLGSGTTVAIVLPAAEATMPFA